MTSAPATAQPTRNPWLALVALCVGFFMILLDSTIVSVVTPILIRDFHAGVSDVIWVTSAYLLAYAVPLLITGRLGDRFGPKRLYVLGLVIFTVASLACGLTSNIAGLVTARVFQGLGAALMSPQSMAVITRLFPSDRRGQAMALWGATAGVATLVGPILGAFLADAWGWPWIFFINVPVGIAALVMALRWVPTFEPHRHQFDIPGVLLSAVGTCLLVFGIQEGETFKWGAIWGPIGVWHVIIAGVLVLLVFAWTQIRHRGEPLVPPVLFADRNFTLSVFAITMVGFAVTAFVLPFMIWAQTARGWSPTTSALLLAPSAVMSFALAAPAGKLVDRIQPRILATMGLLGYATSLWWLSTVMTPTAHWWDFIAPATLSGIASSFMWGPLSTSATRSLPPHHAGAGSGVYNSSRQLGAVVGSAAIAALMGYLLREHMASTRNPVAAMSTALSQSMWLPVAVLLLAAVASACFEKVTMRPRGKVPVEAG